VRDLVGDPDLAVEITGTSLWTVNHNYATEYSSGRVFCAGDAVHRHPPSNGLGSNTSVQDAYNLAWKLAMVVRGEAGPALLDTYTAERAPVGKQIVDRANLSRDQFGPIFQVLGVTPDADEHTIANGLAAVLAPTPEGAERRRELREAVELKNYEFNAHGVEMNHRYRSTAVAEDDLPAERWPHDPELFHQPGTRPGAKLPHVWLVDADGHRVSTLDLVGRGGFTLVTGLSGTAWEATELPVRVVRIGTAGARDAYGDWGRVSDVAEDGCLLVRPDGYIAWRAESASVGLEALRTAWNRLLSIEVPALV